MIGQQSNNQDRIAALEHQIAAMQAELAILKGVSPAMGAMCAACRLIVERGGAATCNCVIFGPKVTCAVVA